MNMALAWRTVKLQGAVYCRWLVLLICCCDAPLQVRLLAVYGLTDEKKSQADNLLKLFSRSSKVRALMYS